MEGLTVLEYFISTHGARKGLADTALRTADSGYLTRRLVDVSQDVIVREEDCGTDDYIEAPLILDDAPNKSVAGRVAAVDIMKPIKDGKPGKTVVIEKGAEISDERAPPPRRGVRRVRRHGDDPGPLGAQVPQRVGALPAVLRHVPRDRRHGRDRRRGGHHRGPVDRRARHAAHHADVPHGRRASGSGDITHGLPRVVEIFEARNPKGAGTLTDVGGKVDVEDAERTIKVTVTPTALDADGELPDAKEYSFPRRTRLLVRQGATVEAGDPLTEGSLNPADLLLLKSATSTELYLVNEVQKVYKSQGVEIHDKHIELIVRQMLKKVRVDTNGDTALLPGQLVDKVVLERENARVKKEKGELATFEPIILGITKASLATESFLSAASFQETTKVLTDAAIEGKVDRLNGLKENVIIGKLIPAATGLKRYRQIAIEPTEPFVVTSPRPEAEAELLAALEEIGDGDGFDFDALDLTLDEPVLEAEARRGRARAARRRGGVDEVQPGSD